MNRNYVCSLKRSSLIFLVKISYTRCHLYPFLSADYFDSKEKYFEDCAICNNVRFEVLKSEKFESAISLTKLGVAVRCEMRATVKLVKPERIFV